MLVTKGVAVAAPRRFTATLSRRWASLKTRRTTLAGVLALCGVSNAMGRLSASKVVLAFVVGQQLARAAQHITLEIVGFAGDDTRAVKNLKDARPVVVRRTLALAIQCALGQPVNAALHHEQSRRAAQLIVADAPREAAAVPGANG